MPSLVKVRLVLLTLLGPVPAVVAAGCGGGGGDSSSGTDPASAMPAKAPFYIDFTLQPEGETKKNIETLARNLAGINDLGGLIVSELEKSASDEDEEFDFEKEVEPWLGEEGGLFLQEYAEEDFEGVGAAVQVSDEDEARAFVDKQAEGEDEAPKSGSYNGVDFKIEADDGTTIGVFDGLVGFGADEATFKWMVDASEGRNLGGNEDFTSAIGNVPDESAADLFVDIGALIEEAG